MQILRHNGTSARWKVELFQVWKKLVLSPRLSYFDPLHLIRDVHIRP